MVMCSCLYYFYFIFKNYVESVPQDLLSKSEVMRISATDIDDGINSAIQYDLSPRMPQDSNYFRIDQNTGVIYLDRAIDVRIILYIVIKSIIFNINWFFSLNLIHKLLLISLARSRLQIQNASHCHRSRPCSQVGYDGSRDLGSRIAQKSTDFHIRPARRRHLSAGKPD